MERLESAVSCPNCQNGTLLRIHRHWWMRLVLFSAHYLCEYCHARFLKTYRGSYFQVAKGGWAWWRTC